MPAIARAELESLLRHRKLDHTLTTALPAADLADARWLVPTGIPDLDERLQGGVPRGHFSEVLGARSSGRFAVVLSALARATARGEAVALIDPLDMFDPASAAASGIDFSRMLWIRGDASSSTRVSLSCEYGTLQKNVDGAVKSLNLVLQAGGFGLVVLDVAPLMEAAPHVIRRLPFTTWLRLHRVIEGSQTACVLIGSASVARSAGGVTVQLRASRADKADRPDGQEHAVLPSLTHRAYQPYPAISARVIRARHVESDRDVCVPVSAAAG